MRVLLAYVLLLWPALAGATLLSASTLAERLERADLVFVGRLTSERVLRVGGQVMTESRFAVREVLSGRAGAEVAITHFGGREGAFVYEVPGDPSFVAGRDYLLLTYAHRDGRRYLVHMGLGAYELDGERASHAVDVGLVGPSGEVTPGPVRATVLLDEVRRTLAELARRPR